MGNTSGTFQQWRSAWSGIHPQLQALACTMLILTVVAIVWISGRTPVPAEYVDLFAAPLSRAEQGRIRLALAQSGLTDHRLENDRLLVPHDVQAKYLKQISQAGVLPRHLAPADTASPAANPFLSRSEQERLQQVRREENLRQLLLGLPFVEDAPSVRIDVREPGSLYGTPDMRCVVSIQPHGNLVLGRPELETIQQNIVSSVAGLRAEQVLINDLNSAAAWDHAALQAGSANEKNAALDRLRQQRLIEHDLQVHLADWPGVEASVEVVLPASACPGPDLERLMASSAPDGSPPAETGAEPPALPGAGSNSPARVPFSLPEARIAQAPARTAGHASPAGLIPPSLPRFEVRLLVDNEAVRHFLSRHQKDSVSADPALVRQRLQEELEARLGPLLQRTEFGPGTVLPLRIRFAAVPAVATPPSAGVWSALGSRGQGALVAAGSGLALCVLVMASMRRRKTLPLPSVEAIPEAKAASAKPDVWLDDSADHESRERLKRQIDELIETNPDAAARVIKTWIRDAA